MTCEDAELALALQYTEPETTEGRELSAHLCTCQDCRELRAMLLLVMALEKIARAYRQSASVITAFGRHVA